jgi:hypothetical protein
MEVWKLVPQISSGDSPAPNPLGSMEIGDFGAKNPSQPCPPRFWRALQILDSSGMGRPLDGQRLGGHLGVREIGQIAWSNGQHIGISAVFRGTDVVIEFSNLREHLE